MPSVQLFNKLVRRDAVPAPPHAPPTSLRRASRRSNMTSVASAESATAVRTAKAAAYLGAGNSCTSRQFVYNQAIRVRLGN